MFGGLPVELLIESMGLDNFHIVHVSGNPTLITSGWWTSGFAALNIGIPFGSARRTVACYGHEILAHLIEFFGITTEPAQGDRTGCQQMEARHAAGKQAIKLQ